MPSTMTATRSRQNSRLWTATSSLLLAATIGSTWSLSTGAGRSSSPSSSTSSVSSASSEPSSLRAFFRAHGTFPPPPNAHAVLKDNSRNGRGILIIGDVHGCYHEMLELHEKAVQANQGIPLAHVVLVGDLGNKGPHSAKVVRHCRTTDRWWAVRGNHDNAALLAACGDPKRCDKPKYAWVHQLDKDDLQWMLELPYTLLIPKGLQGLTRDVLVVHAGLEPDVPLNQQTSETMTTMRNNKGKPWASTHAGPSRVVFGHDAKRGLQQYTHSTGLDTGCVYGKQLTGLLLPQDELISVPAKAEYASIVNNTDTVQ